MKETELDKAACLESYKRYTQKSTSVAFENGAKFGVKWLMKQPLSERLSDTEKEKIKAIYNRKTIPTMEDINKKFVEECLLEAIFGKDILNS